jgi:hypothetical protein
MWGRRRKRKPGGPGGQLDRQLALGRLEDALGEVDRAQADSGQIDERQCAETTQREGTEREGTEREDAGQQRAKPGLAGSSAADDNSQVSARRTRHRSFG